MNVDVIIVGAGVVGLTLALDLGRAGLKVALLEKQNLEHFNQTLDLSQYDGRVFAINFASQSLFKAIGIWDTIKTYRVSPYQFMEVWDEVGAGRIQFNTDLIRPPELGHIIEQKVLLKSLWDGIKACDTVQVISSCELSHFTLSEAVSSLYLKKEDQLKRIQTCLIVGADGANSWVREQAGLKVGGWSYGQSAIVATIQTEKSHERCARQRFATEGPLAILPLKDLHHASIVWMIAPEKAQYLMKLSAEEFSETLTQSFGPVLGKLSLLADKRAIFPLKMQQANHYSTSGCALVGDAAHVIHPLAGLGLNLGLKNVKFLAELIKAQKQKGRMLGHLSYLKQYERQEKMHAMAAIAAMEAFKRGFGTNNAVISHLCNVGLNFVNKHSFFKKCFVHLAMGK